MILDPEKHVPASPAAQPFQSTHRSMARASDDYEYSQGGAWQNPGPLIPDWLGINILFAIVFIRF